MAAGAPRSLWNGSISFGLVHVAVKLYTAVRPKDIHFRMLHDEDLAPIRHRMECPVDGEEVTREHTVRGYEVAKDQYVIIDDKDLEALAPEKQDKTIAIKQFVEPRQIDPIFFEKTYYIGPGQGAEKLFALLLAAMKKTKKVGIAQFVMRGTTYVGAVRFVNGALRLYTMRFEDEIVPPEEIEGIEGEVKITDREVKMAQGLIDSLSSDFDPTQYKDEYTARVMDLIARKSRGEDVTVKPAKDLVATPNHNLVRVLQESIKHAKSKSSSRSAKPAKKRSRARAAT